MIIARDLLFVIFRGSSCWYNKYNDGKYCDCWWLCMRTLPTFYISQSLWELTLAFSFYFRFFSILERDWMFNLHIGTYIRILYNIWYILHKLETYHTLMCVHKTKDKMLMKIDLISGNNVDCAHNVHISNAANSTLMRAFVVWQLKLVSYICLFHYRKHWRSHLTFPLPPPYQYFKAILSCDWQLTFTQPKLVFNSISKKVHWTIDDKKNVAQI